MDYFAQSLTGAKVAFNENSDTSSVKTPQPNSCRFGTLHHLHELTEQKPCVLGALTSLPQYFRHPLPVTASRLASLP
jgi:hypothetical protein